MLLKFFKRGGTDDDRRTLGGSAVKNYLLGTNDQPRKKARLLLGDADEVTEIINGLPFAKVYTSGCLSFHEDDKLAEAQKFDIMADFEAMMFVGLEPHQYTSYWVEHTDKGRVELNFVFPNVELVSGNHLQVYYHNRDLNLVNSWKNLTNDKYGFINPSDLENRRDVTPSIGPNLLKDWDQSNKQKIIDKLKHYQSIEDFKQQLTDVVLTQAALRQQTDEPLTCQDDVAKLLEDFGFEISRRGKDSISIKNPDPTKKNIKLKGVIYERDVTQSIISYIAQRTGPNQAANPIPAGTREDQLRTAETIFPSELEKRRERHYQRYDENLRAARAVSKQQSKLKRQPSTAASKLAQSDLSDLGERQTDLAWDVAANGSAQAADERRLSAHSNSPDGAGQSTASSHNQRNTNLLQHHQQQQQTLRAQMEANHQADIEAIEDSQQQSRALIGQMARNKLRLGIVMGSLLGGLILLMLILTLMNYSQYKDWQETKILVDQSQKELTLLNQQINRTPLQYQAQALTDIQAVYGGGINITPKNPKNAVCQNNGFGYPTLFISQNPYYRPN